MEKKYWLVLLEKWRERKKDGFSIPFIIGSQKFLANKTYIQNVEDLILDIAKDDVAIYITYCMNIDELIIGIKDDSKSRISGKFLELKNKKTNLFQTSFVTNLGDDVESLIINLKEKYDKEILQEKFSKNNRTLGNYLESEITFIKECFNDLI